SHPCERICDATLKPSMPGSMTSSTTRSMRAGCFAMRSSAASPLSASSTSWPSASRLNRRPDAMWTSSSTTSSLDMGSDLSEKGARHLFQDDVEKKVPGTFFIERVWPHFYHGAAGLADG